MSLWKELSICLVKEGELFYEGGIPMYDWFVVQGHICVRECVYVYVCMYIYIRRALFQNAINAKFKKNEFVMPFCCVLNLFTAPSMFHAKSLYFLV